MSRNRIRSRRAALGARSRRAHDRRLAARLAPLTGARLIEAEGYLLDALQATLACLDAKIDATRRRLETLPTPATAGAGAFVEALALDDELALVRDARAEVEAMVEAVRARTPYSPRGALAVMILRGRTRTLLAEAERLGKPVDPHAYAEAERRESLMARFLMHYEADGER